MRQRNRKSKRTSPSSSHSGRDQPLEGCTDVQNFNLQLAHPLHFEGQSREGNRIIGSLVAIVGHTVEGWALNVEDPGKPVTVDIFDGNILLGNAVAFMFRPELSAAGIGNGNHYFQFTLPEIASDDRVHIICARPGKSTQNPTAEEDSLAQRTTKAAIPPHGSTTAEVVIGVVELVTDEGFVKGWAWYPHSPHKRVQIQVLVDGDVVGDTEASLPRSDLLSAGVGDGNCSFSFALPYEVLMRPRGSLVSVRDRVSGRVLPEPRLYRRPEIADAVEKLADLENDARLLTSTVKLAADHAAADTRAAADLFRTVGDFFIQLANVTVAGKPPGCLQTLHGAIEKITTTCPAISLRFPSDPQISICVEAEGTIENIYNTLRAISGLQSKIEAEVVLFDDGTCDEASLLPLVVRNLRYLNADKGLDPVALRNRVVEFARGEFIVFLAGFAEPAGDWLDAVHSTFQQDGRVAMVGAKVLRSNGVIENAGITLVNNRTEALGIGADPSSAAFSHRRPVDAVTTHAFAVRRKAWNQSSGLNENLHSVQAALVDLCARANVANATTIYEPGFTVVLRQ